jgi:hypothetical protein
MLPVVVLNLPWKEALGWSDSEVGSILLDLDLASASAISAGEGDVCPRCRRHPADSVGWLFVPESNTSTPATPEQAAQVKGRKVVMCLCKTTYSFAAVHTVDVGEPIGRAVVRAVSEPARTARAEPLPPGANTTLDEANRIVSRLLPQYVPDNYFPYIHAATRHYYPRIPEAPPEDKK